MDTVIVDPSDPRRAIIGSFSEPTFGVNVNEAAVLTNIHSQALCEGRPCVIHNPTEHRLRHAPLHWRDDRGIFERICQHGVGHPDPDQNEYWEQTGQVYQGVHGCCGCC